MYHDGSVALLALLNLLSSRRAWRLNQTLNRDVGDDGLMVVIMTMMVMLMGRMMMAVGTVVLCIQFHNQHVSVPGAVAFA